MLQQTYHSHQSDYLCHAEKQSKTDENCNFVEAGF